MFGELELWRSAGRHVMVVSAGPVEPRCHRRNIAAKPHFVTPVVIAINIKASITDLINPITI
jgi:hypothetical protein